MNITTRNLHEHTAQEVFDFVCTKVLEQGRPSVKRAPDGGLGGCLYRGDDNCKCALGHVIDDADYHLVNPNGTELGSLSDFSSELMDALGWRSFEDWASPAHFALMMDLQVWHDNAASYIAGRSFKFNEKFIQLAKRGAPLHKVNTNVLERFQ